MSIQAIQRDFASRIHLSDLSLLLLQTERNKSEYSKPRKQKPMPIGPLPIQVIDLNFPDAFSLAILRFLKLFGHIDVTMPSYNSLETSFGRVLRTGAEESGIAKNAYSVQTISTIPLFHQFVVIAQFALNSPTND
jgi:hypothetical protein